ncbi:MAG: ATP-dependent zinc metalloprotease FtsH [Fibrobacteria bacterium]|nr:ATP-dependent zinc metalloprotease FtsH [Fibrobacteria bacterium]
MIISLVILFQIIDSQHAEEKINYSKLKTLMEEEHLTFQKITLRRNNEGYLLKATRPLTPEESADLKDKEKGLLTKVQKSIEVQIPFSDEVHQLIEEWDRKGVEIEFEKETAWVGWIGSFLPLILIIAFVWFMMSRQSQGGPRNIFSFGKSNAKLTNSEKPDINFTDVAGCDEAKQDLEEIIGFLQRPEHYNSLGGKIPKGVLLLGPPGTGKTLLAKAVAGEASVPFFSMSGSDFVEMFVGVGASRVRDLFEQGKKAAPCIVFIDEIDAVGRHRGAGLGGGHDEREQTLNQLLVEMDGFDQNAGVILVAATNRPDVLDPALLRPGRFDRHIVVDAPDAKGREGVLKVHLKKRNVPLNSNVEIDKIAKGTPGLVGADLENLVNEACLLAARFNNKVVSMIDFEEAKDKIMIGTERVSRIISDEEKATTAYHEAGHALITTLMKHADPLHKITIIPRGRALGVTFSLPEKDMYTMSEKQIKDRITILMAGRLAELMIFDQKNTGASNDIETATNLARKYTCEWGMSDALGPLTYGKKQEEVFLGKEISQSRNFSEETARVIDKEVKGLIKEQSEIAQKLLEKHRDKLENLAKALIEHETLEGTEITQALNGDKITATHKSRSYLNFADAKAKKARQNEKSDAKLGETDTKVAKVADAEESKKDDGEEDAPSRGINVDTTA